jgi:hypothetical protein
VSGSRPAWRCGRPSTASPTMRKRPGPAMDRGPCRKDALRTRLCIPELFFIGPEFLRDGSSENLYARFPIPRGKRHWRCGRWRWGRVVKFRPASADDETIRVSGCPGDSGSHARAPLYPRNRTGHEKGGGQKRAQLTGDLFPCRRRCSANDDEVEEDSASEL